MTSTLQLCNHCLLLKSHIEEVLETNIRLHFELTRHIESNSVTLSSCYQQLHYCEQLHCCSQTSLDIRVSGAPHLPKKISVNSIFLRLFFFCYFRKHATTNYRRGCRRLFSLNYFFFLNRKELNSCVKNIHFYTGANFLVPFRFYSPNKF